MSWPNRNPLRIFFNNEKIRTATYTFTPQWNGAMYLMSHRKIYEFGAEFTLYGVMGKDTLRLMVMLDNTASRYGGEWVACACHIKYDYGMTGNEKGQFWFLKREGHFIQQFKMYGENLPTQMLRPWELEVTVVMVHDMTVAELSEYLDSNRRLVASINWPLSTNAQRPPPMDAIVQFRNGVQMRVNKTRMAANVGTNSIRFAWSPSMEPYIVNLEVSESAAATFSKFVHTGTVDREEFDGMNLYYITQIATYFQVMPLIRLCEVELVRQMQNRTCPRETVELLQLSVVPTFAQIADLIRLEYFIKGIPPAM